MPTILALVLKQKLANVYVHIMNNNASNSNNYPNNKYYHPQFPPKENIFFQGKERKKDLQLLRKIDVRFIMRK